jgi:hypothetical protein
LTAIYARIASTAAERAPLYCDWEPSAMERLTAALGRLPDWSVVGDISGRIGAEDEVRAFVLELLGDGGVALDDYSDHCWTASEIDEDRTAEGLRFFDYRAGFGREP